MLQPSQLEHLCINLCAETMQHFYNTHIFKSSIESCRDEGIHCEVEVDYVDNVPCIDLISSLVCNINCVKSNITVRQLANLHTLEVHIDCFKHYVPHVACQQLKQAGRKLLMVSYYIYMDHSKCSTAKNLRKPVLNIYILQSHHNQLLHLQIMQKEGTVVHDFNVGLQRTGLLSMLDVECSIRGTAESYIAKVKVQHKQNPRLFEPKPLEPRTFGIQHFAGRVVYDASDFLGKQISSFTNISSCFTQYRQTEIYVRHVFLETATCINMTCGEITHYSAAHIAQNKVEQSLFPNQSTSLQKKANLNIKSVQFHFSKPFRKCNHFHDTNEINHPDTKFFFLNQL